MERSEYDHDFYDKEGNRVASTSFYIGEYGKPFLSFEGKRFRDLANCFESNLLRNGFNGLWSDWFKTSISVRVNDDIWNEKERKWHKFNEAFAKYIVKAAKELDLTMR